MRALWFPSHFLAAALTLAAAAPARAELRISDLDVFLNDHEVTVHVVLLGSLPEGSRAGSRHTSASSSSSGSISGWPVTAC